MARKKIGPKSSNWDRLSNRGNNDTLQFRDVFEEQQLERSDMQKPMTKTSRLVAAGIAGGFVTIFSWVALSLVALLIGFVGSFISGSGGGAGGGGVSYYELTKISNTKYCYQILDAAGAPLEGAPCYATEMEATDNPPQWYVDAQNAPEVAPVEGEEVAEDNAPSFFTELLTFAWWKLLLSLLFGLLTYGLLYPFLMRNLDAQNQLRDTSDINQHKGDQHIALPDEVMRKFDWFPDVGGHSNVQFSSMISHVMLTNKGLKKVDVSTRAEKDMFDEDGDVVYLKGEILRDANGNVLSTKMPLIDEAFSDELFDASGMPDDKDLRKKYDTTTIPYNPDGKDRDKLGKYKTVADLINADWDFPEYETQRPGGAYLVDTAPVNTMVLAMTRAGKGQTYIEPVIDMWLREKRPNNMVINDPKGELLVKNYVRATMRGFQVVQFNLINAMKTDIYNPLGMAAEAAREGDANKCALYVENIADVFFPTDGGEDPVWPNAANNAFKRAAYGLIDFYLEEERALRAHATRVNMDPKVLETRLDEMWGKVTLYNCYQLFVQLSAKKKKNPVKEVEARAKAGEFGDTSDPDDFRADEYEASRAEAQKREFLWDEADEIDLLTLYFNATANLPRNSMRTMVANADNALRAMGAAEKMLASVYGIAITAMSFFTDPTISTLTSGTPSQNTDLGGLSFPRRMGVRFGANYLKRDHLVGAQVKWDAFADDMFTESLGKDFEHEDTVSREGWARYYFIGKFETDIAYLRLRLLNPQTGMLIRTFFFKFTKDYQTSLNGRYFITDPITGEKIPRNGILVELVPVIDKEATAKLQAESNARFAEENGIQQVEEAPKPAFSGSSSPFGSSLSSLRSSAPKVVKGAPEVAPVVKAYEPGNTTYPHMRLVNLDAGMPDKELSEAQAIISTMVRYSEKPKAVFLVTPPHLMKYAKLILILVKQLVDLNFDKSYMTKSNQKPLYKTRFMLDELGNLQSEGHGISGFETMLSIGLGQEQQFTLILQTLQQLRDVYGESVDKIVQGNAGPLHSLIATPDGWQTMGETEVGDVILTPFGDRTEVTGVFPKGTRPVYRVTLRDGSSSEVCEQHLWQVERWKSAIRYLGGKDANGKRLYVGSGPNGATSVRVSEVIDTLELKSRVDAGKQVDLPRLEPLDYDKRDFVLDPYVLGVILGDGRVGPSGDVAISCSDQFRIDEVRRRGYEVTLRATRPGESQRHGIIGIASTMRELGLVGKRAWEKFVPEEYLYGSVEQRLDLLRGLMDTDGTISAKGEMEFSSSSRALAEGVQALVRSLGGRVSINVKTNVMFTSPNQPTPKAGRDAYRVQNIRLQKLNPFLLPRKAERWVERDDNSGNRVVSVEYVRDEPVQCISVADDRHLYVMNDYMPTHNTSNIVYLKSTDDSMLDTLAKMSGITHRTTADSKTVTKDTERLIKGLNVEGKISVTMTTKEEAVITYNDLAFISERNSIIYRAGDAPVWNRNETILPMSWRLFLNTITHPGHEYTLQTIPTLSTAMDFDVRMNQPDFDKMLSHRMLQAEIAKEKAEVYRLAFDYSDTDIARLDPDVYSDEVMELVDEGMRKLIADETGMDADEVDSSIEDGPEGFYDIDFDNDYTTQQEAAKTQVLMDAFRKNRYAGNNLSREDFMVFHREIEAGTPKMGSLDQQLATAYRQTRAAMQRDSANFSVGANDSLRSADGSVLYIQEMDDATAMQYLQEASQDPETGVYADGDVSELIGYEVTAEFYEFLAEQETWRGIAGGEFDRVMARIILDDVDAE